MITPIPNRPPRPPAVRTQTSPPAVHLTQAHSRRSQAEWQVSIDSGVDIADLRDAIACIPEGTTIRRIDVGGSGSRIDLEMTGPRTARPQNPARQPIISPDMLTPTGEEMEAARLQIGAASAMGTYTTVGARSAGHVGLTIAAIRNGNAHFAAAELRWLHALDIAGRERRETLESEAEASVTALPTVRREVAR